MHRLLVMVVMILEFNAKKNQFYLTEDDVIQNTQYTSDDIYQHNLDLREISEGTYRVMHNFYRGPNPKKHADILQEMINENEALQNALLFSMLEFFRGAIVSGMDLNSYIATVVYNQQTGSATSTEKTNAPHTVREELRLGGLYYPGELL